MGMRGPYEMSDTPSFVWSFLTAALIIGITSGLGKSKERWPKKIRSMVIVGVIAGLSAGTVDFMIRRAMAQRAEAKQIDALYRAVADLPLLNLIMKDNPDDAAEVRHAISLDLKDGTLPRGTRTAVAAIRNRRFAPTAQAANDDTVLAAWQARDAVLEKLHKTDAKHCYEFVSIGIQDAHLLDAEVYALLVASLKAMENVYREGKGKMAKKEDLSEDEWVSLFRTLEMTASELMHLNEPSKFSEREVCDAGTKMYRGVLTKITASDQIRVIKAMLVGQ